MLKRFREWQEGHDKNLQRRYGRLPQPLQAVTDLYPSQQRMKRRAKDGPVSEDQAQPVDAPLASSVTDELERLASLHQQGYLSDAEFAAEKTRLLGGPPVDRW